MTSNEFTFHLADQTDVDGLVDLFIEDYAFYGIDIPPRTEVVAYVEQIVIPSGADTLIAYSDDTPVGFAVAAVLFPAPGGTGQMYMKELFVAAEFRGTGVGKKLLQEVAKLAVSRGCSRLDWTAETTNQPAVDYYHRLGVPILEEKRYFRLDGETLSQFATGD